MPIYEYECCHCGVFEVMQGINEKPLTVCPTCRKRKIKKLISESSFQLKGSGWYVTDYGKGNGKDKNGKKGKEESCESPASETAPAKTETPKAETKTETKKETKSAGSGAAAH